MNLKDQLLQDQKRSLLGHDQVTLDILRFLLSSVKNKEIEVRRELTDEEVLSVISSLLKKSLESITEFQKGNRPDLVEKEQVYVDVYRLYLPEQLTEEELRLLVAKAVEQTGAVTIKDMGKVMGFLKPQTQNRADNSLLSGLVRDSLQG